MVEFVKQSMANVWASAGDVVMPDSAKIQEGWLVEVPPRQYWNWMQNRTDNNLAYIFQKSIPEWDNASEYIINKSYVQHNGVVYKAILTGTNQEPGVATTYWKKAFADSTAASDALAALTPAADRYAYFTGASTATLGTITSFARSILDDADAATVRTTIGAQQADATLTALAGVTTAVNSLLYFTGVDTAASTTLSAFGRTLIDDADAATARTTLGLASGATTTVGTMATQNSTAVNITGGTVSGLTSLATAGDVTVGSTARAANTFVKALSADGYNAGFEAYGAAQGTGYVFVGQDNNQHGGGIFYNGDGTPAFATGETADAVSFYRTNVGAKEVVFSYGATSNNVTFRGTVTASSGFVGNATTATTLQTARNINGVSFNGSADITIADSTKQPLDATLTAVAGLTTAADRLPYFTGVDTAAVTTFTSFARTLLDDTSAATARTTLDVYSKAEVTTQAVDNAIAMAIALG